VGDWVAVGAVTISVGEGDVTGVSSAVEDVDAPPQASRNSSGKMSKVSLFRWELFDKRYFIGKASSPKIRPPILQKSPFNVVQDRQNKSSG
jgi:hypothetical protein